MFQLLRQRSARWLLVLAVLELVLLALCVKLASHLRFLLSLIHI